MSLSPARADYNGHYVRLALEDRASACMRRLEVLAGEISDLSLELQAKELERNHRQQEHAEIIRHLETLTGGKS